MPIPIPIGSLRPVPNKGIRAQETTHTQPRANVGGNVNIASVGDFCAANGAHTGNEPTGTPTEGARIHTSKIVGMKTQAHTNERKSTTEIATTNVNKSTSAMAHVRSA